MTSVVVMGVSGTGKSTVGRVLAERLGLGFVEGDDHHPAANIAKMSAGVPLDDEDRRPWLRELGALLDDADGPVVVTCSALKRSYRDVLRAGASPETVLFVHLVGSRETLGERMRRRDRHFMPASLLDSQLATLEPLQADEWGVEVDVAPGIEEVAADAVRRVRAALASAPH